MRNRQTSRCAKGCHRTVSLLVLVTLALAAATTCDARTRRHHRATAFEVALQPFSMLHSAVHAVAAPIVHDATRLAFDAATAPVRLAYHQARTPPVRPPRPSRDAGADYGTAPVDVPIYTPRRARFAEPATYDEAMHVAYVVPHLPASGMPRAAERADDEDDLETSPDETDKPRAEDLSSWETGGAKPMVAGSLAVLRNGVAYAPSHAPQAVKNAIWAANTLRNKPYIWGGGHGSFYDRGYDCSGTVSFALHGAGVIGSPIPSSDLMRFGERGRGRWFTIYSRNGHTFAVIAGLRLDTTDFQNGGNSGPRWHTDLRDTGGYVARHPAGM
jgi:cell wall-associated NlpC family hydrolase